jgi:hypothetical protein
VLLQACGSFYRCLFLPDVAVAAAVVEGFIINGVSDGHQVEQRSVDVRMSADMVIVLRQCLSISDAPEHILGMRKLTGGEGLFPRPACQGRQCFR